MLQTVKGAEGLFLSSQVRLKMI